MAFPRGLQFESIVQSQDSTQREGKEEGRPITDMVSGGEKYSVYTVV